MYSCWGYYVIIYNYVNTGKQMSVIISAYQSHPSSVPVVAHANHAIIVICWSGARLPASLTCSGVLSPVRRAHPSVSRQNGDPNSIPRLYSISTGRIKTSAGVHEGLIREGHGWPGGTVGCARWSVRHEVWTVNGAIWRPRQGGLSRRRQDDQSCTQCTRQLAWEMYPPGSSQKDHCVWNRHNFLSHDVMITHYYNPSYNVVLTQ